MSARWPGFNERRRDEADEKEFFGSSLKYFTDR